MTSSDSDTVEKIRFSCPSCSKSIKASANHAGKKGKCPRCDKLFTIPENTKKIVAKSRSTDQPNFDSLQERSAAATSSMIDAQPIIDTRPVTLSPDKQQSNSGIWWLAFSILTGVGVICALVVMILVNGNDDETDIAANENNNVANSVNAVEKESNELKPSQASVRVPPFRLTAGQAISGETNFVELIIRSDLAFAKGMLLRPNSSNTWYEVRPLETDHLKFKTELTGNLIPRMLWHEQPYVILDNDSAVVFSHPDDKSLGKEFSPLPKPFPTKLQPKGFVEISTGKDHNQENYYGVIFDIPEREFIPTDAIYKEMQERRKETPLKTPRELMKAYYAERMTLHLADGKTEKAKYFYSQSEDGKTKTTMYTPGISQELKQDNPPSDEMEHHIVLWEGELDDNAKPMRIQIDDQVPVFVPDIKMDPETTSIDVPKIPNIKIPDIKIPDIPIVPTIPTF